MFARNEYYQRDQRLKLPRKNYIFMSNPFPWTYHVQSLASAIYPIGVLLYHNLHDSFIYRRYFVKQSPVKADENEEFVCKMEEELAALSERRQRPLKNVKLSMVLVDAIEPETVGSFTFNYGPLFKFNTRLVINNVEQFRKTFKNVNSFIDIQESFVPVTNVSDKQLENVLLSDRAVKFVLARQLEKGDSVAHILVPAATGMAVFNGAVALLNPLTRLFGSVIALAMTFAFSVFTTFIIVKFFNDRRILHHDRAVYSCDNEDYEKGCEEYLQKSLELGKLLREMNGAESRVGQRFAENGDDLLQAVKYSQRLDALHKYLKEQEEMRKTIARKIKTGKIKHPNI